MKAYLCGSMTGLKDQGAGWRKKLRKWLDKHGIESYDPCKEETGEHKQYGISRKHKADWEMFPQALQERIIVKDLSEIQGKADFLLCHFTKYSTGTVSELTFAYYLGIPTYIVSDIPLVGWPGTIARAPENALFETFDELKTFLKEKYALKRSN